MKQFVDLEGLRIFTELLKEALASNTPEESLDTQEDIIEEE